MSQQEFDHIEWGSPSSGQACNWLKTDSLFLTVVSKQIEADKLTEKLLDALTVWKPSPHRLLVSHLRNDLEANGGMVEDTALKNNLIQAGLEGGELEITEHEAVVISQLRYEYALNLLHRLGSNLSRVGLDFVNP